MPKYYIKSGDVKFIVDRQDEQDAIKYAVSYFSDRKILFSPKICITEKGFSDFKTWICFDTKDYIRLQ